VPHTQEEELEDFDGGAESQRFLIAEVGLSEAAVDDLAAKFPPLRGEMWWRRRAGQKVLDVYFLEDTLPELVDMLMGKKLGFSTEQVAAVFAAAPPLLGREVGDVGAVLRFYKDEVGVRFIHVVYMLVCTAIRTVIIVISIMRNSVSSSIQCSTVPLHILHIASISETKYMQQY
jgi:hypothetical protein